MQTELTTKDHYAPTIDIKMREEFLKRLDDAPEKVDKAQGYDTVPISTLETTLDEVYMGLWETKNFRHQVIANEIVGTIELSVFDPSAKTWLTRTGGASVMIRKQKDADIQDIGKKIKNGLVMDFPKLHSMCLKAAAKTLGKKFGRDLNRKWEDSYEDVYSQQIDYAAVEDEVIRKMNDCTTIDELKAVYEQYPHLKENKQFKKVFSSKKTQLNYGR